MSFSVFLAYVRRSKRVAVVQAIRGCGLTAWSEGPVMGHGRAAAGQEVEHLRIEAIVPCSLVEALTQAVAQAAETGGPGDGIIAAIPASSFLGLGHSDEVRKGNDARAAQVA